MNFFTKSIYKIADSTDASIYREVPQEVVYPKTIEDIDELEHEAHHRKTCLIPRAAEGVAKDIPDYVLTVGVPAKQIGWVCVYKNRLDESLKCDCERSNTLNGYTLIKNR